ncbi:profilin, required for normal timing of actin polymerization in response to thermal stress [Arthrobotrys megalospora]
MSWQGFVDNSLVGSGQIDYAAIISSTGDSVYAASQIFRLRPAETRTIANAFESPDEVLSEGIHINDEHYVCMMMGDRTLLCQHGWGSGVVCVKTKKTVIVAHYPETVAAGNATKVAEELGDYFVKNDD